MEGTEFKIYRNTHSLTNPDEKTRTKRTKTLPLEWGAWGGGGWVERERVTGGREEGGRRETTRRVDLSPEPVQVGVPVKEGYSFVVCLSSSDVRGRYGRVDKGGDTVRMRWSQRGPTDGGWGFVYP